MKPTADRTQKTSIIPLLDDIYDMITWGDFARSFFPDHSVSWFYNKMRGVDGNGGPGAFTDEEKKQLAKSLIQLSDRIRAAAERVAASQPAVRA